MMNRRKSIDSDEIPLTPRKIRETSKRVKHNPKRTSSQTKSTLDDEDEEEDDEEEDFKLENISNSSVAFSEKSDPKSPKHAQADNHSKERSWMRSINSPNDGNGIPRPGTENSNSTFQTSGIEYLSSSDEVQIKSPSSLTFKKRQKNRTNSYNKTPIDSGNNSFDIDVIVHQENIPKSPISSQGFRETKQFLVENKSSSESEIQRVKKKYPVPLPRLKTTAKVDMDRVDLIDASSHEPSLSSPMKRISTSSSHSDKMSYIQETDDDVIVEKKSKSKKKRRTKTTKGLQEEINQLHEKRSPHTTPLKETFETIQYSYETIINVIIHHCDPLLDDINKIKHPRVKVHIFNINSEQYLKKSEKDRFVSYYQEHDNIDYIMPILSQPFNFIENKSITPSWEENIIFNDDFNVILQKHDPSIIMFEIMDNVDISKVTSRYKKLGPEGGWYKIAWAFLKPLGSNGILNYNKKLRLQLYKPKSKNSNRDDSNEVFSWWKSGNWEAYPATFYVTLKGISPPSSVLPSNRSQTALQIEHSRDTLLSIDYEVDRSIDEIKSVTSIKNSPHESTDIIPSRLPFQTCEIPNRKHILIKTNHAGCFCVKFNHSGTYLACALADINAFDIHIYTVLDFKHISTLYGHQELIYDLDWTSNDKYLLSASSDGMALVWNIENIENTPEQILPHPAFIYSAKFCTNKNFDVITGCFDKIIRIWSKPYKSHEYQLSQELEGHTGFVNCLCIKNNKSFLSGDSDGILILWVESKHKTKTDSAIWQLEKKIVINEFENTIINRIIHHTWSERFIIHTRDNTIRMIDINNESVTHRYKGILNSRIQKISCISPCGNLLFGPSEDESICIWQVDTAELIATYSGKKWYEGVTCVDYHPSEHIIAVSMYGTHSKPILINTYTDKMKSDVGLLILQNQNNHHQSNRELKIVENHDYQYENDPEISSNISSFDNKSLLTSTQIETPKNKQIKIKHFKNILDKMDLILDRESTPIKETNQRLEKIQKSLADTTKIKEDSSASFINNNYKINNSASSDKIDENLKLLKMTLNQINIRKQKEKSTSSKRSVESNDEYCQQKHHSPSTSSTKELQSSQNEHSIEEKPKKRLHIFKDNIINSPMSEPLKQASHESLNSPISEKIIHFKETINGLNSPFHQSIPSGHSTPSGKTYSISSSFSSNNTFIIHKSEESQQKCPPKLFQKVKQTTLSSTTDDKETIATINELPKMRPYSAGPIVNINERISPARARYHKHKYLMPRPSPLVNH